MKVKRNSVPISAELSDSEGEEDFMRETDESEGEPDEHDANNASVNLRIKRKVTDTDDNAPHTKKKKLESELYKPPTVDELNQLRETENLFHSNLFRLQIEEVLSEVKIKIKYKKLFDSWFDKLKSSVESIKETDEFKLWDKNLLHNKRGVHVPVPNIPVEEKGTFKFLKPSNIQIIGSYPFDGYVGPNIVVDVMIEMPSKLFHKQDYQNYRYFKKKALYLAHITSNIGQDIAEEKTFIGNNLKPMLKLVPSGKLNKKIVVHVHIAAEADSFKLNRFLPEKNSVRPSWFFDNEDGENGTLLPTPHYNSAMLHDLTMLTANSENLRIIKEYPNLRDGIILLKIWLGQRQMLKGQDAFNGHIVTMYVLYLLRVKKLNTFMSSYQIVRNVWNCLVQSDWSTKGVAMCEDREIEKRILEYHKHYDCVFLDTTGYHNLAANISKNTFSWIQREADICLKHLDDMHTNSFEALFMKKVPFYRAFDHLICVRDTKAVMGMVDKKSSTIDKLDYGVDKRSQVIKILTTTLKEGLGSRTDRICILPGEFHQWKCTDPMPESIGNIVIGLELNPDHCFTVIDKGPEANLPEAVAFRTFWGKKSELRRFQDGSIREAVVWGKGKTLWEKRIICRRIVSFLLREKLNIFKDDYTYVADQLDGFLKLNKIEVTKFAYGTGEEATLQVLKALDSLEKELMSLTDVPLSISGVQGSSSVFRYTEVFPPLATVHKPDDEIHDQTENCLTFKKNLRDITPTYVFPLEAILQLSSSGKWPEELEAVRKTNAAFHIQIADCLRKQHNLKAQGNFSHVDVFKEGFVFRLRVAHQKEIALMKQQIDENGVIKYRDTEESIELENKLFHLPKLSSAIHGLHSQQPSYGAACCLTKRWLSAQLLDNSHIPDVVVELIMASIYLTSAPYKPAQMPQVAFFRILEVFARGLWNTDPVIVNFNDEMSREDILAVETLFGTSRESLPPLFISTPYDQQKSLCTKKAPSLLILNRISALAKESLKLFEDQVYTKAMLDCRPMFRPPLSEYDCLIHLKPSLNPRRLLALDLDEDYPSITWRPYKYHSEQKIPIVDFDPVQLYLRELRNGYDEFALFFHDTYGGMVIGVLIKPAALQRKDFKVPNINCRRLDNDGNLVLNISAMIQDFYTLGKDLVSAIDVRTKNISLT